MYALCRLPPPKQRFVQCVSPGTATNSAVRVFGSITLMPPRSRVATHTLPLASTARESKRWYVGDPYARRLPCGEVGDALAGLASWPGPLSSHAHRRALSVSATYSVFPSCDS